MPYTDQVMTFVRRLGDERRGWILLVLAVYALLLVVNPVLHDDLACHLKSPTHCSACTASPSASRVEAAGPALPVPAEVGRVECAEHRFEPSTPVLIVAGRSPPA